MDYFAIIESAAQSGCLGINGIKAPTEAQMQAGNYRMGRCEYKGLQLVFEQPRNSYREGTAKDGKKWRNRMAAHYGYLAGTKGADGDGIDIFVGSNPETDNIFIINQIAPATGSFDEHKVMIGFLGAADAKRAYQESYDADWRGFGDMVALTLDQFKWWLKFGATTKPISHKSLPYDGSLDMSEIQWDSAALPVNTDLAGIMYQLRTEDTDGLLLDSVTVADILEDAESVLALDALVIPMNMLDRKTKQLQNIMNMSGGSLTASAMQLTAPFKNRGTTNIAAVYELSDGQTVSIFFHNPDSTPNRLAPTDDLVSWKWLLNKKDITLLVAPEKGQDLNPREVARRVMRLAEKNSARFAKANENRAARMANITGLKQQVETKAATLKGIEDEIEQVQAKLDDPTRAPAPGNSETTTVPEDESMIGFTAEDVANFGAKEAARRAAWFEKYGYEQYEKDPAFIALKKYLLKEFGTDVIENFAGGLVNGRDPIEVSVEQANERNRTEPTEQELYVHNQTIEGHNLLKALLSLGWTNESQSTKNKALWYVTRTILGGFKASANPEGRRRLSAKLENGQMKAEHGDNVLVSVPYDASKTPEQNAQVFNDAVSAIPGSGAVATAAVEEVNFKILGQERYYSNGKTYKWDDGINRYVVGSGAKQVKLKKSDVVNHWVDSYSELSSLGNVQITDVGGENVYFTKDGISYYTKLLNTDDWKVGPADFSEVVDPSLAAVQSQQPLPWTGAPDDEENRYFGTRVNMIAKNPRLNFSGMATLHKVFNGGDLITVKWDEEAFKTPVRISADDYSIEVVELVDNETNRQESSFAKGDNMLDKFQKLLKDNVKFFGPFVANDLARVLSDTLSYGSFSAENVQQAKDRIAYVAKKFIQDMNVKDDYPEKMADYPVGFTAQRLRERAEAVLKKMDSQYGNESVYAGMQRALIELIGGSDELTQRYNSAIGSVEIRYRDTVNKLLSAAKEIDERLGDEEEQAEQATYEKFSLSKLKMPSPTQLGAKIIEKGTGAPKIRIIGTNEEGGWTNSHMLDLIKRPASLMKVVEDVFGKIGQGSKVNLMPEQAIERVVMMAKRHEVALEPIAIKDGNVVLVNESKGLLTLVDSRYMGYFVKQHPGCEFYASVKDAMGSIAVRKGGKLVGIMMPVRGNAEMKRALRAAQATDAPAQQAAQQPAPASNPDRDYLNQVIAGQVDFMAPEVADQLVAIAEKYGADAEMTALAEQAAEAYSAAVVEAAKSALGGEPAKKPDAGVANAKSSDYDIANANQENEQMAADTGKKPALRIGQLVEHSEMSGVWKVINLTDKRVVVKEVGEKIKFGENDETGIALHGKNLSTKSMVAENLSPVDQSLKVFNAGEAIPKNKMQMEWAARDAALAEKSKVKQDEKLKQVKKDYPNIIKAFELFPAYIDADDKHNKAKDALASFKRAKPSNDDDDSEEAGDYREKLGDLERALNEAKKELEKAEKPFMRVATKVADETKEWIKAEENKDTDYLFKISDGMGVHAAVYDFLV